VPVVVGQHGRHRGGGGGERAGPGTIDGVLTGGVRGGDTGEDDDTDRHRHHGSHHRRDGAATGDHSGVSWLASQRSWERTSSIRSLV
jgi:hypothetical protein